ncbi:DeoR/GlpR family DNA-binding transcription regulator [Duganella sp. sic0402]|uniref:DeoR/GlpR family DNA-binding transcription regulator n=1 Tax=Duganella sp. sic0402 TaxID=2854786 RepID=UPI001C479CB6|nr:DeoR/GlpR family DNA-binding transcription regulator [Duganella sp. sic0402]MBV7536935.1 DeoR/GlpR family DNA-binding transcription regulator [Duganella sp. sic0402]
MKPEPLLLPERHELIFKQLHAEGRVLAAALARQLHVTEDTIRRDLRDLAAAGLCQKVYGGAVRMPPGPEAGTLVQRMERGQDGKSRLAAAAVKLVAPGSTIFLDAGSSNLAVAEALPVAPVTVLTNAPSIAARLLDRPHVDLIMIGGRIRQSLGGSVGATAMRELELIHPDLYFIGACGVDVQAGVTAVDYEEAEFKRRLAAHSKATAVVATGSKIGAVASYHVLPISQLTHLIVEAETGVDVAEAYAAAGTRLLRAGA